MGFSMVQFRDKVKDRITLQMQATANKVASGQPKDFSEYQRQVGRIAGGREAMDALDSVFNEMFGKEDDE